MSKFSIASLKTYGGNWVETGRELLSSYDSKWFKNIKSAVVTCKEQEWGTSTAICLTLKNGQMNFLPLSTKSNLTEGDSVNPKSIEIIELERDGETTWRADGKAIEEDED